MLGKLIAAEWRGLWKPTVILIAIMLVAGLAGTACFHGVDVASGYYTSSSSFLTSATAGLLMASLFCGFLVWASLVALFVFLVVRFYRTMFTDEGYLTLTLPVSTLQLVGAKFLVAYCVLLVGAVLALVLVSLMMATVSSGELSFTWIVALAGGMVGLMDLSEFGSTVGGCVNVVIMTGFNLGLAFAALSVGAWWARRHKVAAAVGVYLGASWLLSLVFSSVDFAVILGSYNSVLLSALAIVRMIAYAGAAVGCFFLAVYVVKRKVDLS